MMPTTLRDIPGATIEISCQRCNKHASLERKALVKKFGATMKLVQLRRVLSIGCDLVGTGDCEASFPSLQHIDAVDGGAHV